jgi:hypothetical protein
MKSLRNAREGRFIGDIRLIRYFIKIRVYVAWQKS